MSIFTVKFNYFYMTEGLGAIYRTECKYESGNFIVNRSLGGIIAVELKLYHSR